MSLLVHTSTARTSVKVLSRKGSEAIVGGHLVVFDDPASPTKDLAGDYFTSETYFGAQKGNGADCLFHHGIPLKAELAGLADVILPPLKVEQDDVGLFATVALDMADAYQAAIIELAQKGALGWSSGSAPHMVKRDADGWLKRWPIIEGSLTPQPCEPRTVTTTGVIKSLDALKAEAYKIRDGEGFRAHVWRVEDALYEALGWSWWLFEVYSDHVIAEDESGAIGAAGTLYRIRYTDEGGVISCADDQ